MAAKGKIFHIRGECLNHRGKKKTRDMRQINKKNPCFVYYQVKQKYNYHYFYIHISSIINVDSKKTIYEFYYPYETNS